MTKDTDAASTKITAPGVIVNNDARYTGAIHLAEADASIHHRRQEERQVLEDAERALFRSPEFAASSPREPSAVVHHQ